MELWASDVTFCCVIGFLTGILAASFAWSVIAIVFAVAFCCACFIFAKQASKKDIRIVSIFFFIFAVTLSFGNFYYAFFLRVQNSMTKLPTGKTVNFSGIISDEPQLSGQSMLFPLSLEKPYAGTITVFGPADSNFGYGDEVKIKGSISQPKTKNEGPAVFSRDVSLISQHKAFWLREELIDLKLAIIRKFNQFLPDEQAMLLGGIAFGAKQNFKADLKAALAASGTTHLVAISGYNITIIAVAAEEIFGGFLSRRKKFYATVLLIVLFVLMTGLQASAIRAAIMGFIALFAKESGKNFSMRNTIAFSAVIMAAFDPTILAQNVGFQLSFLSLLGIVCLSEPVKKLFRSGDDGTLGWKESARTTFCAQLGTMPVLIAVFGQSSATSIGANVLVLGTVPLTMFLGVALAIVAFIAYYPAWLIARATGLLLAYQLSVIRFFATVALPLPFQFNSVIVFILYYATLGWFAYYYR